MKQWFRITLISTAALLMVAGSVLAGPSKGDGEPDQPLRARKAQMDVPVEPVGFSAAETAPQAQSGDEADLSRVLWKVYLKLLKHFVL